MEIILDKKIANLYQSGLSVKQIADNLGIGYSRIRYSLDKQSIPRRNHSKASRMLHLTKFGREQSNVKDNLTAEEEKLRIMGIMLYWGEGTKAGNSVAFSNSDPDMIIIFLKFLREICRVDEKRLRLLLHLYLDQNEINMKHFWSNITDISLSQFSKTFIHKQKRGTYKKISRYGTISLRYSDKELLNTINNWLAEYRNASVAQW